MADGSEDKQDERVLDPGNLDAQKGIARVLEGRGDREGAIREWRNLENSLDEPTKQEAKEALARLNAGS